jgi:hypothetical protein
MTLGVILPWLPTWAIKRIQNFAFKSNFDRFNNMTSTGKKIASDIIQREIQALESHALEGKDVMSNLGTFDYLYIMINLRFIHIVRANLSQDPKQRMEEEELLSQTLCVKYLQCSTEF